jgi:hypothetical protein
MATALPWKLGVITPNLSSGIQRSWNTRIRPLPGNIRLYSSVREALADSSWDWVLTHNINDLMDTREVFLPKVFLFHGTLSGRILQDKSNIDKKLYINNLKMILAAYKARVLYVSNLKRIDWGIPGDVLCPGIDCSQYGGYRGTLPGILQVCNHMRERGVMMGWNIHREVCRELPSMILGENPGLKSCRVAYNWDDLKEQLRTYRIYLYTPVFPYEDGYNLALLEAMATGMPVAALNHKTSPVRNGIEGVTASTAERLREKIIQLFEDPATARELGNGARRMVEQKYSISEFRNSWELFASKL